MQRRPRWSFLLFRFRQRFPQGLNLFCQAIFQRVNARAGDGGDGIKRQLFPLRHGLQFFQLVGVRHVDLTGDDDARFVFQAVAEAFQFRFNHLVIFDGVWASAGIGHIDNVNQKTGALNVAEELRSQPGPVMCAFNQAGDVGDDKTFLVRHFADGHDAQVRFQRGEGIVCDFGAGSGDARDKGRLAGVGIADKASIGQQLQLQPNVAFLAGSAKLVLARRLMGGCGEMLVAAAAAAATGEHDPLIRALKVVDLLPGVLVIDDGADRNLEHDIFAVPAGTVGAFAVTAPLCLVLRVIAKMDQSVVALAGLKHHVATATAVASGGSTARHKLFPTKGHAAIAAIAGLDLDSCLIDKHGLSKVFPPCGNRATLSVLPDGGQGFEFDQSGRERRMMQQRGVSIPGWMAQGCVAGVILLAGGMAALPAWGGKKKTESAVTANGGPIRKVFVRAASTDMVSAASTQLLNDTCLTTVQDPRQADAVLDVGMGLPSVGSSDPSMPDVFAQSTPHAQTLGNDKSRVQASASATCTDAKDGGCSGTSTTPAGVLSATSGGWQPDSGAKLDVSLDSTGNAVQELWSPNDRSKHSWSDQLREAAGCPVCPGGHSNRHRYKTYREWIQAECPSVLGTR